MKLTEQQIAEIDDALLSMGIKFLDIRVEMTDHAAAVIETMEGDFERRLRKYLYENKKELQQNYSRFRKKASIKAVKMLLGNIFSIRFILVFALMFAMVLGKYNYDGIEKTLSLVFTLWAVSIPLVFIHTGYVQFIRSKRLFSTEQRLLPVVSGVAFLLFIHLNTLGNAKEIDDMIKLMYSAFVSSFYMITFLTYRDLSAFYKSKYHIA